MCVIIKKEFPRAIYAEQSFHRKLRAFSRGFGNPTTAVKFMHAFSTADPPPPPFRLNSSASEIRKGATRENIRSRASAAAESSPRPPSVTVLIPPPFSLILPLMPGYYGILEGCSLARAYPCIDRARTFGALIKILCGNVPSTLHREKERERERER